MIPTITVFERSPDRGQGLSRDMRVRWALEEVGQPYDVRLVSFEAMKEPAHLALHPFGQIPTYEEGDLVLFESGAIVLHLAERHRGLLPDDCTVNFACSLPSSRSKSASPDNSGNARMPARSPCKVRRGVAPDASKVNVPLARPS